ncbi:hypothetical protein [Brevundimonas variabilis]|uniref:Lipoprotein n=1 Tax=Brevundimonas variabilis TaxID=74312 RepID=A0A7W9CIC7_9CAUL|nr:hypothetical protein [Brevundimonas variabilis]MBB5745923.1 hypothetical protein [Brevundimonas variabilis]
MKTGRLLPVLGAALAMAGCFGSPTPFDRPWVDFGCSEPGVCRVRGTLAINDGGVWPRGRLALDDGQCLPVDLSSEFVRNRQSWDGRLVAIRGRAVSRVVDGACADKALLLYAERVSLRPSL